VLVAPTLHQDVEHVVVLIHCSPEGVPFAMNCQKDFIQVPLVPWPGASTLQLIRVVLSKFQTPLTDGFMALQTFYVKPYSCGTARRRYAPYKLSAQTTLCRLSCSM
jgi:hypothetical protein